MLYLSEGAPIGYLWWAMPTVLRSAGLPIESITALTSLLVLPWAFKFIWAPLIDTCRSAAWTYRSWILTLQLLMGLTLLPVAIIDPKTHFSVLAVVLVAHAVIAATQDVAIDAFCISICPPQERGSINGWMQAGMLLGRAIFGGGALLMVDTLGQAVVVALLVVSVWSSSVLLLAARGLEPLPSVQGRVRERIGEFSRKLKTAARQASTWAGLAFAAVGGAAYEAVGAVAGPYLIDQGLTRSDVGSFLGIPAVLCMLIGAVLGGLSADRFGKKRSVRAFLILSVLVVFSLSAIDSLMPSGGMAWKLSTLAGLYVAIGLFTASSYALFMDITDPSLGATQFSMFMGGTNLCEAWGALVVGRMIPTFGYAAAFAIVSMSSLLTLPLFRFFPNSPLPARQHQSR
jgi:MFS transporter (putative signal transducer)